MLYGRGRGGEVVNYRPNESPSFGVAKPLKITAISPIVIIIIIIIIIIIHNQIILRSQKIHSLFQQLKGQGRLTIINTNQTRI